MYYNTVSLFHVRCAHLPKRRRRNNSTITNVTKLFLRLSGNITESTNSEGVGIQALVPTLTKLILQITVAFRMLCNPLMLLSAKDDGIDDMGELQLSQRV